MIAQSQQPFLNARTDAAFRFLGLPTQVRATAESTNGAFGLIEHWSMPPGFASPYHTHHAEDESFYVLEGELAILVDGKWLHAGPGSFAYGPREIPHGFKVIGNSPARMLLQCTPGGFEQFVLDQATGIAQPPAPPDMAKMMELAARHKIDIHGPLPEQPQAFKNIADNKTLNHQWIKAFNDRDWTAEQGIRTPDFRAILSGAPGPLDNQSWSGFMAAFTTAFPDSKITIDACIAEDDTVATRWTLTGTHQGTFQGIPPTGHTIRFNGIEYNRVVDGRFAEHWSMFDNIALLQQIGAMPA